MKSDSSRYLDLLEQRLKLLQTLARALVDARSDFTAMDLEGIERRIVEQEQLCAQIHALDGDLDQLQERCAEKTGKASRGATDCAELRPLATAENGEAMRSALARVLEAQMEVARLNQAHQEMLRRSHRTVRILLNFVNSYAPTYSLPSPLSAGALPGERV